MYVCMYICMCVYMLRAEAHRAPDHLITANEWPQRNNKTADTQSTQKKKALDND